MFFSKFVIATTNSNKKSQIIDFFSYWVKKLNASSPQFLSLDDITKTKSPISPPEEIGKSFKENALIKGQYYRQFTSLPILCDDSGLVVPSLGGEPGIDSASYAGKERNSILNNQLLLENLTYQKDRFAYLTSTSILYTDQGYFIGQGVLYGEISKTMHPQYRDSFGYEPIFYLPKYQKYLNEISNELRLEISHRSLSIYSLLLDLIHVKIHQ